MAEFREEDHKRDKGGKFSKTGGGSSPKEVEKKHFPHVRIKEEHPDLTDAEISSILEGVPKKAIAFNKDREDTKHHQRHITEMGFKNKKEYQEAGLLFWNSGEGKIFYNKRKGRYCKYNAKNGFFLSISEDGIVFTFFKLDHGHLEKYERQGDCIWLN